MKFRQIISAICAIAVSVTFIPQTIISAENMTSYVTKTVNARDIAVKTTDGGVYTNGVSGTISGGELGYNSPQDGTDGKIYLYIPGIDASKLEAISICYGFNTSKRGYCSRMEILRRGQYIGKRIRRKRNRQKCICFC